MTGAPGRNRTHNRLTRIQLLYPLSYGRIEEKARTHLAMQRHPAREESQGAQGAGLHGGGSARAGKHGSATDRVQQRLAAAGVDAQQLHGRGAGAVERCRSTGVVASNLDGFASRLHLEDRVVVLHDGLVEHDVLKFFGMNTHIRSFAAVGGGLNQDQAVVACVLTDAEQRAQLAEVLERQPVIATGLDEVVRLRIQHVAVVIEDRVLLDLGVAIQPFLNLGSAISRKAFGPVNDWQAEGFRHFHGGKRQPPCGGQNDLHISQPAELLNKGDGRVIEAAHSLFGEVEREALVCDGSANTVQDAIDIEEQNLHHSLLTLTTNTFSRWCLVTGGVKKSEAVFGGLTNFVAALACLETVPALFVRNVLEQEAHQCPDADGEHSGSSKGNKKSHTSLLRLRGLGGRCADQFGRQVFPRDGSNNPVLNPCWEDIRPLVNRLVGSADCLGGSGNGSAKQCDGFSLEHD